MTKGKRWALGCLAVFASFGLLIGGCFYFGFRAVEATQPGADRFHGLYNASDWNTIWRESDTRWRFVMDRPGSDRYFVSVKKVLGRYLSSERMGWFKHTSGLLAVTYKTQFEMGEAAETFTWFKEAGVTRLAGYNLQIHSPRVDIVPVPVEKNQ
ncbi:MAG: hypothetical protein H0W86_07685 [Armatimonadetes bacterium]|nr:hypothetical protein [Armatimonadota bacterium]